MDARRATRDLAGPAGRRAELTSSEFDLLVAFLRRPGQALSRAELTRALRGRAWDYFDRSIDTLVARLRKKIDAPGAPSLIRSVRGVGYVFCAPVARTRRADALRPAPALAKQPSRPGRERIVESAARSGASIRGARVSAAQRVSASRAATPSTISTARDERSASGQRGSVRGRMEHVLHAVDEDRRLGPVGEREQTLQPQKPRAEPSRRAPTGSWAKAIGSIGASLRKTKVFTAMRGDRGGRSVARRGRRRPGHGEEIRRPKIRRPRRRGSARPD